MAKSGGFPSLAGCTIRDHVKGRAAGVYVAAGSRVKVGADCVFARNAKGRVVREGPYGKVEEEGGEEDEDDEDE